MSKEDKDIIDQINRLLEKLHQTDGNLFGSHVTLIKIEKGAQYVNHIGSQVFNTDKTVAPEKEQSLSIEPPELPEALATTEAMVLWKKAQDAGWVDENFQPKLSRTQAALLADCMAELLGIKEKWKVFELFWHRKYMRSDYNLALTRKRSLDFQDDLKRLLN